MPSPLDSAHVDIPCKVSWDSMLVLADEAVRWCGKCKSNVYDVASMTRERAEQILRDDAPSCMRLFRRPDGTVLTKDCSPPPFRGFAPGFAPMLGRVVTRKPEATEAKEEVDADDLVDDFVSNPTGNLKAFQEALRTRAKRTKSDLERTLAEEALALTEGYTRGRLTIDELHAELEDMLESRRRAEGGC